MRLFEPGIQLRENLPTFNKVDYFSRGKIKLAMKERKFIFYWRFHWKLLIFSSWSKTEWIIKSLEDS